MIDIERALTQLAEEIDYPVTPPIAARATVAIKHGTTPRHRWRRTALIAAAVVIAVTTLLLVSPATRRAVADFLGIDGVRISFDHRNATPTPRALGEELGLGRPMSVDGAQRAVDFSIGIPRLLGRPDEVFFDSYVAGGEVSMLYRPTRGIDAASATGVAVLLDEFEGRADHALFDKLALTGTQVDRVDVAGSPGFFIHGAPHLVYVDRDGDPFEEDPRLAGNVLVWERGAVTYRLEAEISKADALAIARSIP